MSISSLQGSIQSGKENGSGKVVSFQQYKFGVAPINKKVPKDAEEIK